MDYSINRRPLLDASDSEEENVDLRTQSYQESIRIKDNKPLFKPPEPRDKYLIVYIIFYFLGITTLLPWNFFITADNYWMYKFREIGNLTRPIVINPKRTTLQAEFTSYVSVASSVPNIVFLVLNTALTHRISLQKRIVGSLLFMLILFIATTVFVKINTDKWQETFFTITLATVVLLNIGSAVLSASIFGIIGRFSSRYITAIVGGQALGGIFAALCQIVSLSLGATPEHSAFVYFMVGNVMLLVALVAYIVLSRTVFFKYHISDQCGLGLNEFQPELVRPRIINHKAIVKKILPYGMGVFLVFLITLSIYPGVSVLIESQGKGKGNTWNDVYFVPVVAYLMFSTGDYIGRLLGGLIQRPKQGTWILVINVARLVFIPLLLFCNAQPRSNIPVYIDNDYYYMVIIWLFAITNGYLANITVICAPRVVEDFEKETASSMMTVFMGVGISIGSVISLLLVKVI